jgi:hypothetical protein
LRFDLPTAPPVGRARLWVRALRGSAVGFRVHVSSTSHWNEHAVTLRSAPRFGPIIASSGPFAAGRWIGVDITAGVRGRRVVTFALTTTSRAAVVLAGRAAGPKSRPWLQITAAPSEAPAHASSSAPLQASPSTVPDATPPAVIAPPSVTLSAQDHAVSAGSGEWSGSEPLSFAYQWRRCDRSGAACSDIAGATATTHRLAHEDVAATLRVAVTASNAAGSTTAVSDATSVVSLGDAGELPPPTKPPTISGSAQESDLLSAHPATWTVRRAAIAYQWERCDQQSGACSPIAGATSSSYLLTSADVGSTIRVIENASAPDGTAGSATSAPTAVVWPAPSGGGDPLLVGAGDIADGSSGARDTAGLIAGIVHANPGRVTVFTAGDNAYPDGSAAAYESNYDPTWGVFKSITKPVPGNHEYEYDHTASGYFGYFGALAGNPATGYYAYDLGAWRVYALNSEVSHSSGSAEARWLAADLTAHASTQCVLAYWHEPLFAASQNDPAGRDLWQILYAHGADVVITGHNHTYERYAPQTPDGQPDPLYGITEFVVGTGGAPLSGSGIAPPNRAAAIDAHGVLELTLHPTGYDFRFIGVGGQQDSGVLTSCH